MKEETREKFSETTIIDFQKKILQWYKNNKRDLPWRKTKDPYYIMVSEFMLQQTQVSRVIPYYFRFLEKFPTIYKAANARKAEILKLWSGLGYNRRALQFREASRIVVKKYDGIIPSDYNKLLELSGFGDYMASAIPAFAYNRKAAVVDANIRRVFLLEFQLPSDMSPRVLKRIVGQFVPAGKSRVWHNALMDYGAALPSDMKRSVPALTKQSKFDGSFRQLRGNILKNVILSKNLHISVLKTMIRDERIDAALSELSREGFIKIHDEIVTI